MGKLTAELQPNQVKSNTPLILSRETLDQYTTEGAIPPRLKGKLKDHKDDKPLREVADASKSPGHKLAKVLNKLFDPYTGKNKNSSKRRQATHPVYKRRKI